MWLFGNSQTNKEVYNNLPRLTISQFSYLPKTLPWRKYPHIHREEYEFGFIAKGRGFLYLPGTSAAISAGSLTLVPPGVAHYFAAEEGQSLEYYVIRIFHDENIDAEECIRALGCHVGQTRQADLLHGLLCTAAELGQQSGRVISRPIHLLCLAVLDLAIRNLEENGQEIALNAPEYANDILCFLQDHIHEKITLENLSEHFHLSASHVSRVFSKTYHISPINYLIMSRMGRARTYILEDGLSSPEIAKRLAYGDTYQFITAFTKVFGCRPEEYYDFVKRTEE